MPAYEAMQNDELLGARMLNPRGIPEHGCLATTTPLPTTLCDVQVKISGEAQPLFGVFNTGQVNLQLGDYAGDADVTIEYKGQDGTITSEPQRVTIDADATPTVLSYQRFGHPHAVAVHPDGDIVGYTAGTKPLAPGETTTLYFIGAAEARVQAGETAPLDELLQHSGLTVKRNGKPVLASDILYIGSTPGSVGLSQLNLINNGTPGLDEITIEGPQGKGTTALLATAEPGNNTMIVEMATLTSDDRTEAYSGELLDAQTGDVLSTIRGREGLDIAQYRGSKQGEEADAVFTGDGHYTHVRPITLGADDIKFDKIPIRTLPGSRVRFNPLARGDEGPQFRYKYAFNDPNVDEEELNSMMVEIFSNLKSPGTGLGIAAPLQITGPQYDGKLHVRFDTSQEQYQALRKYITSWNTVQELMIEDQTDFENRGQSGIIIVSVR